MSIDDAIKEYEEFLSNISKLNKDIPNSQYTNEEIIERTTQIINWLKELKDLRKSNERLRVGYENTSYVLTNEYLCNQANNNEILEDINKARDIVKKIKSKLHYDNNSYPAGSINKGVIRL